MKECEDLKRQWNKDRIKEVLQLITDGKSTSEAADIMNKRHGTNFSGDAVRSGLNRHGFSATGSIKGHKIPESNPKDGTILSQSQEENGDTIEAKVSSLFNTKRILTDVELLKLAGLDPNIFVVDRVKGSKWSVVTNKHGKQWNYYTSVIAKRKPIDYEAMLKYMDKHIKPFPIKEMSPIMGTILPDCYNDKYLVIPCFDTHFDGKTMPYYKHALEMQANLIAGQGVKYKKIVLILGGDIVHVDSVNSTTTKGTQLATTKVDDMLDEALEYFENLIQYASYNAKAVEVISVAGNHDYTMSYAVARMLQAEFKNLDNVKWDIDLYKHYKATMLGNNMIAATHGDKGKKNYVSIFADKFPQNWAKATYRDLYTGHLHSEETVDLGGIIRRQIPTLKPDVNDQWTQDLGVESHKAFEVVEYNKDRVSAIHYIY